MPKPLESSSGAAWRLAYPFLAAVALVQLGGLLLTTLREGTAVGGWFFLVIRTPEATSLLIERAGALVAVAGMLAALFAGSRAAKYTGAGLAAGWFALISIAEWRMGGAPFTGLSLPAHATRIALPLLIATWSSPAVVLWIGRVAVAITFAVHGYEALQLHPGFVDYLLAADMRIFKLGLDQGTAEVLLRVIGAQDMVIAALLLSGRGLRPVLAWAAAWGLITALSRVVQGSGGALHQTLIRAANGGIPLVLLIACGKDLMSFTFNRFSGRAARAALPALLLLVSAAAQAQTLASGAPGHLRVIWTEDPAHRATISWSTTTSGSSHEVYFDTQPRGGNLAQYANKVVAGQNGAYGSGLPWYHHAELTGLAPATRYYFVVVSDGVASPERHFISAHSDDREFRLLSGGDSRSGVAERRKINELMRGFTEADPGIVAFAHGGDYIDVNTNWHEWSSWLEDHALTFTADGRVLPIIPTRGNHEGDGVLYNRVFGFPGGTSVDYFVTKLGAHTSLITLDTNSSIGGDQRTWLEQQLKAAQSGRWIIPNYHRPAYPAVKTPSGARQFWVPLFEQYNVDVVLESDGHVLKRTVPIRNEKHDPTGIVYLGEGGLGVPQRVPVSQWYLNAPGMAKSAHHVQVLSFSPQKLVYEARGLNGNVEDGYEFQPRRNPPPVEPPPPAQAPALTAVEARTDTQVAITFSVDMDPASLTPAAFAISGDVQVTDVTAPQPRTALLTTTPLVGGTEYTVTVSGVRSAQGASLAAPAVASFTWSGSLNPYQPPVSPEEPPVSPEEPPAPGEQPAPAPLPEGASPGCSSTSSAAVSWTALVGLALASMAVRRRRLALQRARISQGASGPAPRA